MVILLTLLVMSDHSSHTPGNLCCPSFHTILTSGFMTRHDRMLYICLIETYLNGQKQLIPPYTIICRHRAANVTGAQKLHAPPMLLLIDAVSIFPVRKVLFWTVPISNYSIIKQRICRNYMPFNAQMPTRQKHLSVFLSPTPIFSRHSLLLPRTPIRRGKRNAGFSRRRRTAGRRANGL